MRCAKWTSYLKYQNHLIRGTSNTFQDTYWSNRLEKDKLGFKEGREPENNFKVSHFEKEARGKESMFYGLLFWSMELLFLLN